MSRYETLIRETNPGIYIHVPFCAAKCPYCNFYSVKAEESLMDAYTEQICRALAVSAERWQRRADTLYFGGGPEELALLGLRLCQGIDRKEAAAAYPDYDWDGLWQKSRPMIGAGYMKEENERLFFTPEGFLLSNSILARIL